MPELFGFCGSQRRKISFSFKRLCERTKDKPYGWGIASYEGRRSEIINDCYPLHLGGTDPHGDSYTTGGNIVIFCLRLLVGTNSLLEKPHLLERELFDRTWSFVRSEGLPESKLDETPEWEVPTEAEDIVGEEIFSFLLDELGYHFQSHTDLKTKLEVFTGLDQKSEDFGEYSFLLSDSRSLLCFCGSRGKTLSYSESRAFSPKKGRLSSDDYEIILEERAPDETDVLVSTIPLSGENEWKEMKPGELMVIKDGQRLYSHFLPPKEAVSSDIDYSPLRDANDYRILKTIKESPHRISIDSLSQLTGLSIEEVIITIYWLRRKNLVRQDRRDTVYWNRWEATYFTNPFQRGLIQNYLDRIDERLTDTKRGHSDG